MSSYERLVMHHSDAMIAFTKEKSHSSRCGVVVCKRESSEITICPNTQDLSDVLEEKKFKVSLIPGLAGILKLNSGSYFICIIASEPVGEMKGATVYKTTKFKLIRNAPHLNGVCLREAKDDEKYIRMVEKYLNSKHFYFSYEYDLTNLIGKQPASLKIENCNTKFLYNSHLVNSLVKQVKKSISSSEEFSDPNFVLSFCLPLIQGFVETRDFSINGQNMKLTLISRRCPLRSGTRFHCRGADDAGNVSNFVETEQILQTADKFFSFVQCRGSIPFAWGQQINVKYKPKLFLSQERTKNKEMAKAHFSQLAALYGKPVVAVNLINKSGYEKPLGEEFSRLMELEEFKDEFKYLHIDFHHECKAFGWNRLDEILLSLKRFYESLGFYEISSHNFSVLAKQTGVMRVNCVDCLDRTNVFMGMVGRNVLLKQLVQMEIIPPECTTLESFFVAQQTFKTIWADNADAISEIYTGTGALKSDFTRTGKRTFRGVLMDGYKSLLRYWLNNFHDFEAHDSSLLLSGVYKVNRGSASPFKQKLQVKAILLKVLFGYLTLVFVFYLLTERGLRLRALATAVIIMSSFVLTMSSNGKLFVRVPRLTRNNK